MKDVAAASSGPAVAEEEMELVQEETDVTEAQQEEPKRKEKRREGLVQERIISVSIYHVLSKIVFNVTHNIKPVIDRTFTPMINQYLDNPLELHLWQMTRDIIHSMWETMNFAVQNLAVGLLHSRLIV
jgi:hypothetical protein